MLDLEGLLLNCNRDIHRPAVSVSDVVISVYDAEKGTFSVVSDEICAGNAESDRPSAFGENLSELHKLLMEKFPNCRTLVLGQSDGCREWAECGEALPPLTLQYAEYFLGEVYNTGHFEDWNARTAADMIARLFRHKKPEHVPAAFIPSVGVITWGNETAQAVKQLLVLEESCHLALRLRKLVKSCFIYLPPELLYEEYYRHQNLGPSPIQRGNADME